jgi:hypothetical protein
MLFPPHGRLSTLKSRSPFDVMNDRHLRESGHSPKSWDLRYLLRNQSSRYSVFTIGGT